MGGGYTAAPNAGDSLSAIVNKFSIQDAQLADLQRPGKTNLVALYQQVQDALANITSTVTAAIAANSYTKAQIDAKDAATLSSANAFTLAGFTATGGISAADLYTRNGPGTNFTGTRVSSWLQSSDGRVGTAASSERFKTLIRDSRLADKAEAILGIEIDYYSYKAEIAKRDDPTSPDYVGPDYRVHQELGAIAERLHEAGLWEFVIYERDTVTDTRYRDVEVTVTDEDGLEHVETQQEAYTVYLGDTLRLGEDGEPIPFGIHYDLLGLAAIAAGQHLLAVTRDQQRQIDEINQRLGLA